MGLGHPFRMYSIYKFVEVNVRPFSATFSHLLLTTWSGIEIWFGSNTSRVDKRNCTSNPSHLPAGRQGTVRKSLPLHGSYPIAGFIPIRQCTNRLGALLAISANHLIALTLWSFSLLYFLIAHFTNNWFT